MAFTATLAYAANLGNRQIVVSNLQLQPTARGADQMENPMIGDKKVNCDAIGQRKTMAGAARKDDFGVGAFPCRDAKHPDAAMSHAAMSDATRGAPPALGNTMGRQAAPNHGGPGADHFMRGPKL